MSLRSIFVLLSMLLTLRAIRAQECYDDGAEFCIDENDILSADLLPGSILFMDQFYREGESNLSRTIDVDDEVDGSRNKALEEMDYHRKRMNEYLYHGYYAEEIIKEVGLVRVKRRNDFATSSSADENSMPDYLEDQNVTIRDKLLADEGSVNYKKWMLRKDTLDDIRRHHMPSPTRTLQKKHEVYEDPDEGDVAAEFEGEIVAMQPQHAIGKMGKPAGVPYAPDMQPAQTGYNYPTYGAPPVPMSYPPVHLPPEHVYDHDEWEEDEHEVYHSSGKGHELSIKDFFEIALTALAFLAFGLFIIQLLMNITNPMTTASTAATVVTEIDQRFKRHILDTRPLGYEAGNQELNELSHRVLRSIEAGLVAQADSGNCLRRLLCEDNRYSRETQGGRRIWIPVWSLGMSWLSGRMLNRAPWQAMLDSLKASVLGLGRADCESLYPDCQLGRERVKRRRRRRK